jgi:hypothetical protein
MSNAMVVFEMEAEGCANQMAEFRRERGAPRGGEEGETVRQVLDPNRNPRMLVVIIHEEAINQFPRMAYFGGVFSGGEVSVRAMNCIREGQYPVRATIDVAGRWTLRGFCRFSIVYLLFMCVRQCFGHWGQWYGQCGRRGRRKEGSTEREKDQEDEEEDKEEEEEQESGRRKE